MKQHFVVTGVLILVCLWGLNVKGESAEVKKARHKGAIGKVTLRVVDSLGRPVERAWLSGCFFPSDSYANVDGRELYADKEGYFYLEGKTVGEGLYQKAAPRPSS